MSTLSAFLPQIQKEVLEGPSKYDSEDSRNSITPLPPVLSQGLAAVSFFGFLSFFSSLALFIYLTYKLVKWQLQPLPSELRRPLSPEPDSPTTSDVNGFLVPESHFCPKLEPQWEQARQLSFWERLRRDPPNQFLMLIYNLLFADVQQALAFMLNVAWLTRDKVDVGSDTCWAQGWFISTGDLASSLFITAIAIHTYLGVVKGYRMPTWAFYTSIALLWSFNYGLAILGVIITNNGAADGGLYVRAGAWCWINSAYQDLRLHLHYLWIFISLALTSGIYAYIFFHLHVHRKHSPKSCLSTTGEHYPNPDPNGMEPGTPTTMSGSGSSTVSSNTMASTGSGNKRLPPIPESARHPTFLLYPIIYVLCTGPLAMGRIASMAGNDVSLAYFCFAGAMIASAGWLDVALYSSTRRSIVFSGEAPTQDTGIETFAFMRTPPGRRFGNVVFVSGGGAAPKGECHRDKRWNKWSQKAVQTRRNMTGKAKSGHRGGPGGGAAGKESSLKGFGMGAGEVMGMAIQCETVTTVSVEVDHSRMNASNTSLARKGSLSSDRSNISRVGRSLT